MIKINELRIGNYVKYKKSIIKIENINTYYVNEWNDMGCGGRIYINSIQPIPLTEEILLKCGFVKTFEGGTLWYLDDFSVASYDFIYWGGIKIKHLHQFQNLYFALTGKELNIEL